MKDYDALRKQMVEYQIKTRDITDTRFIDAMLKVPRHLFVGTSQWDEAYDDYPLPIGYGQTISQPYMVALMTQLLNLSGKEKVLEIGTGSGYQTAILAELAGMVYTVEIVEDLSMDAQNLLNELGYKNIEFMIGDGYSGWEEHAPYDVIIVTCGPSEVPQPLIEQLADGGRMVIPVGSTYQKLTIMEKIKGDLRKSESIDCRFVPMTRKGKDEG